MATASSRTPEESSSLAPAVERLLRGVRDFVQLGASSHLALEPADVIGMLRRIEEGRKAPADPVSPEDFFLEALEEEVLQLRDNTFEEVETGEGRTEMRPLSDSTWKACLRLMIRQLETEAG